MRCFNLAVHCSSFPCPMGSSMPMSFLLAAFLWFRNRMNITLLWKLKLNDVCCAMLLRGCA